MLYYLFYYHKHVNLEIHLTVYYFSKKGIAKSDKEIAPVKETEVK